MPDLYYAILRAFTLYYATLPHLYYRAPQLTLIIQFSHVNHERQLFLSNRWNTADELEIMCTTVGSHLPWTDFVSHEAFPGLCQRCPASIILRTLLAPLPSCRLLCFQTGKTEWMPWIDHVDPSRGSCSHSNLPPALWTRQAGRTSGLWNKQKTTF